MESASEIRRKLFSNELHIALADIDKLLERVEMILSKCPVDLQQHVVTLLECLEIALKNKDYLTVADILEFDIKAIEWSSYENEVTV